VHGDVSAGNLLVRDGELAAVIDFGQLAVGDPACDLAIAWTFLDHRSRAVFRSTLALDADTWLRGRAWALWKAAIAAAGLADTNAIERRNAARTLEAVLAGV
jgi:aminoglycoside phosphotransferase (APT) family kinase protein